MHDADAAGTVHYSVQTKGTNVNQSVVGEIGLDGGDVVVTNPTSTVHIIVTGNVGYIESDTVVTAGNLGPDAVGGNGEPAHMDLVGAHRRPVRPVAVGSVVVVDAREFTPGGEHLHLAVQSIAGHSVGVIDRVGDGVVKVSSYLVQLGVTTKSPVLPIAGVVTILRNGKTAKQSACLPNGERPWLSKPRPTPSCSAPSPPSHLPAAS